MPPRRPFEGLDHWTCFSPGYWIELGAATDAPEHAFCGPHEIRGAWCYHGDHVLLRFLSLDARDERLGLRELEAPQLHLLYCWRCDVGDLEYRIERDGSVTPLGEREWLDGLRDAGLDPDEVRARLRDPETDFPYRDYPLAFPARAATLRPLDPAEQDALVAAARDGRFAPKLPEALARPRHQVGGLPWLAQPAYAPECGHCGRTMSFVANVADDCGDPRGFTGNASVQVVFFLCPTCRRVRAVNMCD